MKNSALHCSSDGCTALMRQRSIPTTTMQNSVYDDTEEPLKSSHRFPSHESNEMQDAVPQLPIRKESSGVHSLFDLDPTDSLPPQAPARRQSSDRLMAAARRRTQLRDRSSSGSSMPPGPPSSVIIPQDSGLWSAGVSTLMSGDDEDEDDDRFNGILPRLRDESDPNLIQGEMPDVLPWDRIAIGVVVIPENKNAGGSLFHPGWAPGQASPIPPQNNVYRAQSEDGSRDTTSYPSFHFTSSSEPSDANGSIDHVRTLPPPPCQIPPNRSLPQSPPPPPAALLRSPSHNRRSPQMPRRLPGHAAMLVTAPSTPSGQPMEITINNGTRPLQPHPPSQDLPPTYPMSHSQTDISAPSLERQGSRGILPLQSPYASAPNNNVQARHGSRRSYPDPTAIPPSPPARPAQSPPREAATSTRRPAQHYQRQHYQRPSLEGIMIEVAPGVKLPLRGSDETWKAIEDGRVTITTCIACQIELHCLEDAQLVACPNCTMLSPVDQTNQEDSTARFGVGVGVKLEDVIRWIDKKDSEFARIMSS